MRTRFITNLLVLLASGFVVVSSQSFGADTTGWIASVIAVGIIGMTAIAHRDRRHDTLQSSLDASTSSVAVWSIVASVVFSGSALTWVSFADALGLAALAVVGMIVHELRTERLVQILATTEPSGDATVKAADSYPAAA